MQQRRFRAGDVVDDYCPRERRITDHAIVAMIDDRIKQTRCVVCDAEHEYKEGKVPPQRRKRSQSALFSQVLDGLQGPQPPARLAHPDTDPSRHPDALSDEVEALDTAGLMDSDNGHAPLADAAPLSLPDVPPLPPLPVAEPGGQATAISAGDEGPVRRPLIRATLPRPEGQPVITRAIPEFTIRQPNNGRGGRGRRRGGQGPYGQGGQGPTRFGRGGHGQSQRQGDRHHGGHGGRRRGGKKR